MNRSFLVWLLVLVGFAVLTAPFFLAHMGSDVFDSVWGGHKAVELARRFENEVIREYSSMTHHSFVAPNGSFLDELPQNAPLPVVDHGESSASSSVWHNVARLDAPPAIAAAAAVTAALEESRAVASAQTSSGSQRPTSATPVAKTNTALTSSHSSPTVSNQHRFPVLGPGASLHAVAAAHPNPKKQHTQDGTRGAKGTLVCNGKPVDSEVIYWRDVPGDADFESPITPHHHNHRERYLAFAYDQGGWNNIRMGIEIVLVAAHAMGRVLVAPPPQRLYLLGKRSVDPKTGKATNAGPLGFEDFFDMDRLRNHRGLHIMSMEDFLETEAVHGKLKGGKLPPGNKTDVWGRDLWGYFEKVADQAPSWSGKFLAMPASTEHLAADGFHGQSSFFDHPDVAKRLKAFAGKRSPVYYDRQLQKAKLLYFRPGSSARLLQHHYAFTFFADRKMQSFYKRFIRDYMRYQDVIQCAGHEIVAAIRADAAAHHQNSHGAAAGNHSGAGSHAPYYALHVRRGDFQFKEVKISAEEIVKNLGVNEIIPRGAIVYVSTDDPKGICENCLYQRKPCPKGAAAQGITGCIVDPSWRAFKDIAGWEVRFLKDYLADGVLKGVNPNFHGMIESIVCSRADRFAGTWFSTFTGYIHRLRGYHGLAEETYYHSPRRRHAARSGESIGHGFSREYRAGWTDDNGHLV